MTVSSGTPSLARRIAFGLKRLGLDPSPVFQRARNLVLRPVRHEAGDSRREIDQQLQQLAAAIQQGAGSPLRQVELMREELAAVRGEVAALRGHLAGLAGVADDASRRLQLLEQLLGSSGPGPAIPASPGPLVSIVMPTRDRAGCIAEAIASVQAQDYPYWELAIVDDGSVDDTRSVVEPFLGDRRIRYDHIPASGPSAARNHGLLFARGEYIAYLDSDNLWFPGFLAAAVAALAEDTGTGLVYGVLASELHGQGGMQLVLDPFDRARLERLNYIDLNVVVHRRSLYEAQGGFDESLTRMVDWELLLRYTAQAPARALPVLAARYRRRDAQRITDTVPGGPTWLAIRGRVDPPAMPARKPRVLYVVWHYPQLCETYIEGEIRYMLRRGVEVAVWRNIPPVTPFEPLVPVHDGALADVVREFQPDVLHVHWLNFALMHDQELADIGVPVTLRMHGFDANREDFTRLLASRWLHRVYPYPRQLGLLDASDARVRALPVAFDSTYFPPAAAKDPRLVLRASSCLPSKDLELFFEAAKRLPSHRFVFCGVTCGEFEHFPEELRRQATLMDSPVEMRFNVPREEMAELFGRAGIYLHTVHPPGREHATPIGMPISIAEALATGCHVLVRGEPALVDYVGEAGAVYRDLDHAVALIEESTGWSESEWRRRRVLASDLGYFRYADEQVLRTVLEDWQALAARRESLHGEQATAGVA